MNPENDGAVLAERDHLSAAVEGLKRSIALRLIYDIRFDPETGFLCFLDHDVGQPDPHKIPIHAADQAGFLTVRNDDAVTVEYRIAGAGSMESFLLMLEQNVQPCTWKSGTIITLRQPEPLRELMVRQARLVDLGSMVAAVGHEIKQPLFTIAMAAESIQIILRKQAETAPSQHIARCANRIAAQVDRAREIIRRTLRYGRSVSLTSDRSDPTLALDASCAFLLPLLDEHGIKLVTIVAEDLREVGIAQIALEQVLVNAIQNAADSIQSAREAGRTAGKIELYAFVDNDGVRCSVRDDGIGLEKDADTRAFDAFFTTKPVDKGSGIGLFISRQIIDDAAGTIALTANPIAGATLEIWLPLTSEDDILAPPSG